jgi:hypothetical protein
MHVLRFFHARRMVLCLGLLVLAVWANGCSDADPVASMGPEAAQQKGKAMVEARERAFGKGGAPTGKPTMPPPTAPAK